MRTLAAWLLLVSPAVACPFCESETGRQVRQGIFDRHFVDNLLLTLLPFPVLLAIWMIPDLPRSFTTAAGATGMLALFQTTVIALDGNVRTALDLGGASSRADEVGVEAPIPPSEVAQEKSTLDQPLVAFLLGFEPSTYGVVGVLSGAALVLLTLVGCQGQRTQSSLRRPEAPAPELPDHQSPAGPQHPCELTNRERRVGQGRGLLGLGATRRDARGRLPRPRSPAVASAGSVRAPRRGR